MARNSFMCAEDMPIARAERNGIDTLSKFDVLSLALGGGQKNIDIARGLLASTSDYTLRSVLALSEQELCKIKGVGKNIATQIRAFSELTRRMEKESKVEKPKLDSATSIFEYINPYLCSLDHEEAWVILMNNALRLVKAVRISSGGLTETSVDCRIIIREAVLNNSTALALVHNHPSGLIRPSGYDDKITESVKKACELMRIFFVDHVIIGSNNSYGVNYYSYYDEGKI